MGSVQNDLTTQYKATDELCNQHACVQHGNGVYGVVVLDTKVDEVQVCKSKHNAQNE